MVGIFGIPICKPVERELGAFLRFCFYVFRSSSVLRDGDHGVSQTLCVLVLYTGKAKKHGHTF